MRQLALSMMFMSGLMACTSAAASPYDSGNPVHCLTVFAITAGAARTGPLADELSARSLFIARSNGGEQWLRQVDPVGRELAAQWEASQERDKVLGLLEECRNQQDADANFRAALPNLLREWRSSGALAR